MDEEQKNVSKLTDEVMKKLHKKMCDRYLSDSTEDYEGIKHSINMFKTLGELELEGKKLDATILDMEVKRELEGERIDLEKEKLAFEKDKLKFEKEKLNAERSEKKKCSKLEFGKELAKTLIPAAISVFTVVFFAKSATNSAAAQCAVEDRGLFNKAFGKNAQTYANQALNKINRIN